MAYDRGDRADGQRRRPMHRRKKYVFSAGKDNAIDYKDVAKLKRYISERGKILPRRIKQVTVRSIRELLPLQLKDHVT